MSLRAHRRRWCVLASAIVAFAASMGEVRAQSDDDKTRARDLAVEAGELLDAKSYADALDRAERAEALYHAPTHLQMKGEALEGLGRLAEAMAVYEKLEAEPIPDAATEAFQRAKAHAAERLRELMALVPALLLRVHPGDEASATLDGKPFRFGGEAVRVDPGDHALTVESPGYERVERTISLREKGGVKVVEISLRARGSELPPPEPEPEETEPDEPEADDGGEGSYLPGAIVLAIGGGALIGGAIAGGLSLSKVGDLEGACPSKVCTAEQQGDIDTVETLGNVSTALFIVGGAATAAGIILLAVRPGGGDGEEEAHVTPWIGPGSFGVRGAF